VRKYVGEIFDKIKGEEHDRAYHTHTTTVKKIGDFLNISDCD
jgi:hypothetical protein